MSVRVAILGAGPGGLSLARRLSDYEDVEVDLYEKEPHVGGMHKSPEFDGLFYDVGTFLFHDGHGLIETFPETRDLYVEAEYKPLSITPKGGYDRYPFSVGGYLRDNGPVVAVMSGFDLLTSKLLHWRRDTVPAYAKYYTGGTIYRRSGLQEYVNRLHDAPDTELDVKFAQRRMHVLSRQSLRKLAMKAFSRGYRKQAAKSFQQRLVRPKEGMALLYEKMLEIVERQGVQVLTNCQVEAVRREGEEFVLVHSGGQEERYDRVISTIPMPVMSRLIGREPETNIENRDLISLFYRGKFVNQAAAFFNFTYSGKWKRITVFSKFYGMEEGQDYFTVEVTAQDTSPEAVEEARRDFEQHARKFNLLEGEPEFVGSEITPRAYPIYRRGQMPAIEREKAALRNFGIDLVGRQGNFEYVISDVVAQRAQTLVNKMAEELELTAVS